MRQPCWRHLHPSRVGALQIRAQGSVATKVVISGSTVADDCQGAFPVFAVWGILWVGDGFEEIWSQGLDGEILWQVKVSDLVGDAGADSLVGLPLATERNVLFYVGDRLVCLDAKEGGVKWIVEDSRSRDLLDVVKNPPKVFMGPDFEDLLDIDEGGQACYVLSRRGIVRAYALESGNPIAWYPIQGPTESVPGGFVSFGYDFPDAWSPSGKDWVERYVAGLERRPPPVSASDVGRGLIAWSLQPPWLELRVDDSELSRSIEKRFRCHASSSLLCLMGSDLGPAQSDRLYWIRRGGESGGLSRAEWPEPLQVETGLAVGDKHVFGILADRSLCCLDTGDASMCRKQLPLCGGGSETPWVGVIPQGESCIIVERGGGVYRWHGGDEEIEALGSARLSGPVLHVAADGISNRLFLGGEASWTILELS